MSAGFVKVDEQRRTSSPNIFAIGDLAGQPMLAHKASHEGKLAVKVLDAAKRPCGNRGPSRPWSSPIRRSPGAA